VGRTGSTWASTFSFFDVINFLVADQNLPRQSTAGFRYGLPDGAFGEVPFFQFVDTYNARAGRSRGIVDAFGLLDSYPERTKPGRGVRAPRIAIATAAAYVDAPDKAPWPTTPPDERGPLERARLTGIIGAGAGPIQGLESFAWTAEPTTFPARLRWHGGLWMDEHFSQEGLRPISSAALLISPAGQLLHLSG